MKITAILQACAIKLNDRRKRVIHDMVSGVQEKPVFSGLTDSFDSARNTDRELWRSPSDVRVFITAEGGLGLNVAGRVVVMPPERWHELALKCR